MADVTQRKIAVGSSVPMIVELKTDGKSGDVVQPVMVALSDGTARTYEMRGHVVNYEMEPIRFGTVLRGESQKKEAILTWAPGVHLEIGSVLFDAKKILVGIQAAEGEHRIEVSLNPTAPYGPIGEKIRIRTNDPIVPEKVIKVFGIVAFPVTCEPEEVTLGVVEMGKAAEGTFRVKSPYSLPVSVAGISQVSGVPVTWTESRISDSEVEMRVVLNPDREHSYYKSVLQLQLRAGDTERSVEVEVYGVGIGIAGVAS